jgi:hypothetical protein
LHIAASLSLAIFTTNCLAAESGSIDLVGDDLSTWAGDTADWMVVGKVAVDPANEALLSSTPGKGAILNGKTGRTKNLHSKHEHGDVEIHVEFMVPKGSNSGVYLQGRYEIQILDSFGKSDKELKYGDSGGVYQRWDENRDPKGYEGTPPRSNASRPAGEWQSFDIIFKAPRFDSNGKKIRDATFVSVHHNGVLIHQNVTCSGPTRGAKFGKEAATGPLSIQGDHGPVALRNIWVRRLD